MIYVTEQIFGFIWEWFVRVFHHSFVWLWITYRFKTFELTTKQQHQNSNNHLRLSSTSLSSALMTVPTETLIRLNYNNEHFRMCCFANSQVHRYIGVCRASSAFTQSFDCLRICFYCAFILYIFFLLFDLIRCAVHAAGWKETRNWTVFFSLLFKYNVSTSLSVINNNNTPAIVVVIIISAISIDDVINYNKWLAMAKYSM